MASTDAALVNATRMYIIGLGEGMGWANIENILRKAPLYCQPGKLALGPENYIDIIDRQVKTALSRGMTQVQVDETTIGYFLMAGLRDTFPCNEK